MLHTTKQTKKILAAYLALPFCAEVSRGQSDNTIFAILKISGPFPRVRGTPVRRVVCTTRACHKIDSGWGARFYGALPRSKTARRTLLGEVRRSRVGHRAASSQGLPRAQGVRAAISGGCKGEGMHSFKSVVGNVFSYVRVF